MENVFVEKVDGKEFHEEFLRIWESSVRLTHDFLGEEDIQYYKKLIKDQYLDAVDLYLVRKEHKILGFMGVVDTNIEMLFIDPDFRGEGIGRLFVRYALSVLGVLSVDVNEQNEKALKFYLKMGFEIEKRSPFDSDRKPFPILHLKKH